MVSLRLIGALVSVLAMVGVFTVTSDRYWKVSGKGGFRCMENSFLQYEIEAMNQDFLQLFTLAYGSSVQQCLKAGGLVPVLATVKVWTV